MSGPEQQTQLELWSAQLNERVLALVTAILEDLPDIGYEAVGPVRVKIDAKIVPKGSNVVVDVNVVKSPDGLVTPVPREPWVWCKSMFRHDTVGYVCTLPPGHEGRHECWEDNGTCVANWP